MSASKINADGNNEIRLFSGRAHPGLAREIAQNLKVPLRQIDLGDFPNSETRVQIMESIRRKDVCIIQPTCWPTNRNVMELALMLDAFRRASAGEITAVISYFGYGRQDRKATSREPISARVVARMFTEVGGADRIITVDLHAAQIQAFVDVPMDHLTAATTIAKHLKKGISPDAIIVSPDAGRAKLAEKYAINLGLPLALMHKRRSGTSGEIVEVVDVVGDVKGMTPILVDDEIASGSIANQARFLVEQKGSKPCIIAATHGILVGKSLERLSDDCVREVVVTNTVPISPKKRKALPKLTVLSMGPLLAEVINKVHKGESVSEVFLKDNMTVAV